MAYNVRVEKRRILDLLCSHQFIIPYFQRNYDGNEKNVGELIDDLIDYHRLIIKNKKRSEYHLGVMSGTRSRAGTRSNSVVLIDGQQRLTTILLMLKAISIKLGKDFKSYFFMDGEGKKKSEYRFIRSPKNKGETLFKLLESPKPFDYPEFKEPTYVRNYKIIHEYLLDFDEKANALYEAIKNTIVSGVSFRKEDEAERIFETINTRGKKLEIKDLVKNYLFSRAHKFPLAKVEELAEIYEINIEKALTSQKGSLQEKFFRYLIAYKQPKPIKEIKDIYSDFKNVYERDEICKDFDTLKSEIERIIHYTKLYFNIHPPLADECNEVDNFKTAKSLFYKSFLPTKDELKNLYIQLSEQNTELLEQRGKKYKLIGNGLMTEYDIYEFITKYYTFRSIINGKFNIPEIIKALRAKKEPMSIDDFVTFLNELGDDVKLPAPEEFIEWIPKVDKNPPILVKLILLAVELNLQEYHNESAEYYNVKSCYIEFIFPTKSSKGEEEFEHQGRGDFYVLDKSKHLISNLTLLTKKLDSDISESIFSSKKKAICSENNFYINKWLRKFDKYDEVLLKKRGRFIIDNFAKFFKIPISSKLKKRLDENPRG